MQRIPEPELMTDEAQCQAYASADFAASNQAFAEIVRGLLPADATRVLDLGCGPGDVMLRLAHVCPSLRITAVDGSPAMIRLAATAIEAAKLGLSIVTMQGYVPGLPFNDGQFDAVLSKDFLHHLPDPMSLWLEVRRLAKPGGFICVMDLRRPTSAQAALEIVEAVAANEAEILKFDFYNSLLAAFTPDEIRDQLQAAGLDLRITVSGDRHMLIQGYVT
ncbi:MAG: class I SAM-dependent methyltransferase [Planctomycetota bacterium]|nr:class I SAM-dependent methyltransferase [Planctomycetota bacterium]